MGKINRFGQAAIITKEEFWRIRIALKKSSHRLLLDLAYYTGERWGAICQLKVKDVYRNSLNSIPHQEITFRATTRKASPDGRKKTRQVPIHGELDTILRNYTPEEYGWLFPGNQGKHLSLRGADKFLREAVKIAGLESKGISTHSTRRTFITNLNNKGISLPVIKHITGHRDMQSLVKYVEVTPEQAKHAIELISG